MEQVQGIEAGQIWIESDKTKGEAFGIIKYVGAKHLIYYFGLGYDELFKRNFNFNSKSYELSIEKDKFLERYSPTKFSYQIQ